VDELLHAVDWPEAAQPVIVVGHQPTLGQAAAKLMTGASATWAVRKGAIWWLRLRERDGGEVVLQTVLSPDQV
jgi:phosphohistidine phosphatase